jgi:hypothetical protein
MVISLDMKRRHNEEEIHVFQVAIKNMLTLFYARSDTPPHPSLNKLLTFITLLFAKFENNNNKKTKTKQKTMFKN